MFIVTCVRVAIDAFIVKNMQFLLVLLQFIYRIAIASVGPFGVGLLFLSFSKRYRIRIIQLVLVRAISIAVIKLWNSFEVMDTFRKRL